MTIGLIDSNKCSICNKKIWFWQKDKRVLSEPDDIGERFGQHIHAKCQEGRIC